MKKAYIATTGSYSDYCIIGAFSSQEKLDKFIKNNPCCKPCILDLDAKQDFKHISTFHCEIDFFSGEIINRQTEITNVDTSKKIKLLQRWFRANGNKGRDICHIVSTISFDHAEKCAVEARQMYLRNNKKWDHEAMDIYTESKFYG